MATKKANMGIDCEGLYCTKAKLIELSQRGKKWGYNRQLGDGIGMVPDFNYPVAHAFFHHHKMGVPVEEHVRICISIQGNLVFCDMPKDEFAKLPRKKNVAA